jgi:hypothetical protein
LTVAEKRVEESWKKGKDGGGREEEDEDDRK